MQSLYGIILSTVILPSVIVPVLSRHNTSTLANVSIQYSSWTKTFFFASLVTLTASTVLVNNTNPSGIIPIKAATVLTIACLKSFPCKSNWLKNNNIPTGIITKEIIFIILFKEFIISEFTFRFCFASWDIWAT